MNEANQARPPKKIANWLIGVLLALVAVGAYLVLGMRAGLHS